MPVPRDLSPVRALFAVLAALALGATASTATAAPTPQAPRAPVSDPAGRYCAVDLSEQKSACFTTEQDLVSYGSTLASLPLVSVYNWINYGQGGGYSIYYGDHACTATTSDAEYGLPGLTHPYNSNNPSGIQENNTYSSVSTYTAQSCDIKLFDGADYTGASSEWIDRCTHLGGSGTGDCPAVNWYDRAGSYQLS
ncbi:hypothetical protein ACIP2X_09025 [Streptomyces sp. NPDC089424]|uniref:hypothetical protein n=1 Tax=Streptomyces sp. NPDC089424 TaxID=3365917 RepID=UPI0037F2FA4D